MSLFKKINDSLNKIILSGSSLLTGVVFAAPPAPATQAEIDAGRQVQTDASGLNFKIPNFAEILTALIRLFFVIAGLAALFMLLTGALAWITSGGNKENVEKARDKITQALVGIILIVVVLAVMWSMENLVFNQRLCFGLSCPVTIPGLLNAAPTPVP